MGAGNNKVGNIMNRITIGSPIIVGVTERRIYFRSFISQGDGEKWIQMFLIQGLLDKHICEI